MTCTSSSERSVGTNPGTSERDFYPKPLLASLDAKLENFFHQEFWSGYRGFGYIRIPWIWTKLEPFRASSTWTPDAAKTPCYKNCWLECRWEVATATKDFEKTSYLEKIRSVYFWKRYFWRKRLYLETSSARTQGATIWSDCWEAKVWREEKHDLISHPHTFPRRQGLSWQKIHNGFGFQKGKQRLQSQSFVLKLELGFPALKRGPNHMNVAKRRHANRFKFNSNNSRNKGFQQQKTPTLCKLKKDNGKPFPVPWNVPTPPKKTHEIAEKFVSLRKQIVATKCLASPVLKNSAPAGVKQKFCKEETHKLTFIVYAGCSNFPSP